MRFGKLLVGVGLAIGFCGMRSAVRADAITYTGASGSLAASATFTLTGSTLVITLQNTATVKAAHAADTLTGVYWNDASSIGGTFSSAWRWLRSRVKWEVQIRRIWATSLMVGRSVLL